ncbi:MAG: hypothetical protein OEQ12_04770 [Nitrosopumilus sp.]|nr:hypothetical protein [Nitrosopumilus sp.]
MKLREHSELGLTDDDLQLLCGIWDEKSAILIWDDRNAGYRGQNSLSKYDWPES